MSTTSAYRIGDVVVELTSDDAPLRERFQLLYGECAVTAPHALPLVRLTTRHEDAQVVAEFTGGPDVDLAAFIGAILPGRGFETVSAGGTVRVSMPGEGGEARFTPDGARMLAAPDADWRALAANLAVSRAMAAQPGVLFFHATSARVGDRALIACGPKRAGKTTLALALGTRGHGLYGDELAALRIATRELLPMRRALAVRDGPAAPAAARALERLDAHRERFPDGEVRTRAAVADVLGAGAPAPAPLAALFLLRSFASRAAAEPVAPSPAVVGALTPLGASLWGRPPAAVLMTMLRVLAPVRIFQLDAGAPDDTAALVERLMETA